MTPPTATSGEVHNFAVSVDIHQRIADRIRRLPVSVPRQNRPSSPARQGNSPAVVPQCDSTCAPKVACVTVAGFVQMGNAVVRHMWGAWLSKCGGMWDLGIGDVDNDAPCDASPEDLSAVTCPKECRSSKQCTKACTNPGVRAKGRQLKSHEKIRARGFVGRWTVWAVTMFGWLVLALGMGGKDTAGVGNKGVLVCPCVCARARARVSPTCHFPDYWVSLYTTFSSLFRQFCMAPPRPQRFIPQQFWHYVQHINHNCTTCRSGACSRGTAMLLIRLRPQASGASVWGCHHGRRSQPLTFLGRVAQGHSWVRLMTAQLCKGLSPRKGGNWPAQLVQDGQVMLTGRMKPDSSTEDNQ